MKYLFAFLIGFIGILTMASCGSGSTEGSNSNIDASYPLFSCVIYEDNNGELKNSDQERVCAVRIYSRGEPMNLNFSTEINWNGLELKEVYLKNGKVYTEYPYSSKEDELIPIATYNMYSQGSTLYYDFFEVANTQEVKELAEAKKREREEAETEQERARIEREKNTWNGASSLEELKTNINGTIWHSQPDHQYGGLMHKFVFDNGTIKRYSAQGKDGKWEDDYVYYSSYKVEQKRDSGGNNFILISFGDDSDLDHVNQQIAFIDQCKTVVWFIGGNPAGQLTYGDFKWSDSL